MWKGNTRLSEAIKQWTEDRLTHWLTSSWGRGLAEVLTALDASGAAGAIEFKPSDPDGDAWKDWEEPVWLGCEWDCGAGERLRVGCSRKTVNALAALAQPGGASDEELLATFSELGGQAAAAAAGAADSRIGKATRCSGVTPAEAPQDPELAVEFHFKLDGAAHLIVLHPNAELIGLLFPGIEALGQTSVPEPPVEQSVVQHESEPQSEIPEVARRNLDMLMGVELQVSVSFGRTRLALEDVLKLASGSIVELNRSATDPVEVMVNESVVARGEVVVVDGNYGIRVTEVTSRKERIQSIF